MNKIYVAWRNPTTTSWHPIGLLKHESGSYSFEYLAGVSRADGFNRPAEFPDFRKKYHSRSLFPLFKNRMMATGRPDHTRYLDWLQLEKKDAGTLAELAMSGGRRTGDSFELFSVPTQSSNGFYKVAFFLHGLRYKSDEVTSHASSLRAGDSLQFEPELINPHDVCAHKITHNDWDLGYVPRYLSCDIAELLRADRMFSPADKLSATLSVDAVNIEAPLSHRILCLFSVRWPTNFLPLQDDDYESLFDKALVELL
jgi:hypothetical protein